MFFLDPRQLCRKNAVQLQNRSLGETEIRFSKAYALSDIAEFCLSLPSDLGIYAPTLSVWRDGEACEDGENNENGKEAETALAFSYDGTSGGIDRYRLSFPIRNIAERVGLLFFTVAFSAGREKLYFSSVNNVDGRLIKKADRPYDTDGNADGIPIVPFRMLVYADDYTVPEWYRDSVMYHVFVDRFCKGSVPVPKKPTAVLNEDWENGIPQYGEKQGDFCANNMFFGGTLYGIAEKLDYIASLGVNVLYLSPIFDAYSNHKYDTGDYEHIDSMFGGDEAFSVLSEECKKRGIRIILDGVFNHTGDDSRYFNRYGRYDSIGAYQNERSPYHNWYRFRRFPDDYESWWGITILPKLNGTDPAVRNYFVGKDGIVPQYLRKGVSGFRLDVADELSDEFLEELRIGAREARNDAILIGEVWENAADKIAYGKRRSYFCGAQLDGVMNYPVKDAIIRFVTAADAEELKNTVCDIYSSYPAFVSRALMNLLGTHDTERILTVLGSERHKTLSNHELSTFRMSNEEYAKAKRRLLCASVLQYTLPGVPSLFYGDEVGVQGGHDPFCRATFPWGREDTELLSHYQRLGTLRRNSPALCRGTLEIVVAENGVFSFVRRYRSETITVMVNASDEIRDYTLPTSAVDLLHNTSQQGGQLFSLVPMCAYIMKEQDENAANRQS